MDVCYYYDLGFCELFAGVDTLDERVRTESFLLRRMNAGPGFMADMIVGLIIIAVATAAVWKSCMVGFVWVFDQVIEACCVFSKGLLGMGEGGGFRRLLIENGGLLSYIHDMTAIS